MTNKITTEQATKALTELSAQGQDQLTGLRADHVRFDQRVAILKAYFAQQAEKLSE
jgi:hypothetical protein